MDNSPKHLEESDDLSDEPADKAAIIAALSRRFRAPLGRFFEKRIGRQAEIDDLVQEVFLHLAKGGRIESVRQPEAYLFRTAANLLRDRQRRLVAHLAEAHESFEEAVHGSTLESLTPEHELLGSQAIQQLVAALYDLPARAREVWALYHLEDLSQVEIAMRLGVTVSAIEKHMSRATAHLLRRLDHFL